MKQSLFYSRAFALLCIPTTGALATSDMIRQHIIFKSSDTLSTDGMLTMILQSAYTQMQDYPIIFEKLKAYVAPTLDQLHANDPELYKELSEPIIAYQNGTATIQEAQEQLTTLLSDPIIALRLLYNINKIYNQETELAHATISSNHETLLYQYQKTKDSLKHTTTVCLILSYMHFSRWLGSSYFWPIW